MPAAERELHAQQPVARGVVAARRPRRPGRGRCRSAHPGQVRAVGREQALGILDDPLEDLVGVGQGGDPGGDVAQRPFGLGAAGERRLRALQLVDEARVGDRDGGLLGEAAEDRRVERRRRRAARRLKPRWRRAARPRR